MGKSGKSGAKKKKGANTNPNPNPNPNNSDANLASEVFLKRANEFKEKGNKRYQDKDYIGALEHYNDGIKLIPKMHPDRALFHSNRAACFMQMSPIDYDSVILECNLALQVDPRFARALFRRARAYEVQGRYDMAMADVQDLLSSDPTHRDALEMASRIQRARQEVQLDPHSPLSTAPLGASAVRGAPVAGLGPSLPARPVPKKGAGSVNISSEQQQPSVTENGPHDKTHLPNVGVKPASGSSKVQDKSSKDKSSGPSTEATIQWRQLKLVYDHDIRLAQMPINCSFKNLREIVSKRFPSSKSILIKYKDNDGDLVTITCTPELKLAEACVDSLLPKDLESDKLNSVGMLRLHIMEVDPDQEPPIVEEEEIAIDNEAAKIHDSGSHSSLGESGMDIIETEHKKTNDSFVEEMPERNPDPSEEAGNKEVEIDDWLIEFAQLFRNNLGINTDGHIDLHEIGMEQCAEALEETVTSEEAQTLFDKAAIKFQEVAALAFFNWGNVHMCEARKRIPVDENAPQELKDALVRTAYHWVNEKYSLAREKYEQALSIKPDFYEGLLALGQQQFEMAKLHWSHVLAKKEDLSSLDSSEIFNLFDSAEEKMKAATEMWEKVEEQRANEMKDPTSIQTEELLNRRKKPENDGETSGGAPIEPTPDELAEQAAVMRSQIHLFWANILFERSQIEFRLGVDVDVWRKNLDGAVERFKLAGASEADISTVRSNHSSNADVAAGEGKKAY